MSKKCQSCGKEPAKYQIKKWDNNVESEISLCESCAGERGFAPLGGKKGGVAENLGELLEGMEGVGEGVVGSVQCRVCGLLYSTFRQTGRLGCPRCYVAFEKQLRPLLRRVHGAIRHTGKAPAADDLNTARRQELRRLQEEMERAIGREEFELAAALRDQIRALKGEATPSEPAARVPAGKGRSEAKPAGGGRGGPSERRRPAGGSSGQ